MKKVSKRAGVLKVMPSTGSTAAGKRVARSTKSERKPRTAFDLCEMVAQHIEEEPRRYNQGTWMKRLSPRDFKLAFGVAPPCGTMACRAGWLVHLHDGPSVDAAIVNTGFHSMFTPTRANQILGMDEKDTSDLFNGSAVRSYTDAIGKPRFGTKAYAREGAVGLRRFMREHAARLKARLLKDVPKLGA